MANEESLKREGDVNTGCRREQWRSRLSEKDREILKADEAVFLKQSMSTPCLNVITKAEGCYITDGSGKIYLDFHGNSLHQIGYKNRQVLAAVEKQLQELPFVPRRYTAAVIVEAAQALIDKTLSKDFRVLFTPAGTAAVGLALKIARKATGRHKVISLWESFHGAGLDAISAGGEYVFSKDMGPLLPGFIKAIPYNAYRNLLHSECPQQVADFCLDYMEYIMEQEGDVGAVLLEPIRATDTHVPPASYFQRLRAICDKYGSLLIFDEIPTALGRSGEFYTHQLFGVEPDILIVGKGLGGAVLPQAAVLARTGLDCGAEVSLGHYTHEKPAAGCAAAIATIRFIDENRLLENCRLQSAFAAACGRELHRKYACIGDFRIAGLLLSFELVKDRSSKERHPELAEKILYYCLEQGLSFKVSSGNCITWHPPLIVTREQIAAAFQILEEALLHCGDR